MHAVIASVAHRGMFVFKFQFVVSAAKIICSLFDCHIVFATIKTGNKIVSRRFRIDFVSCEKQCTGSVDVPSCAFIIIYFYFDISVG